MFHKAMLIWFAFSASWFVLFVLGVIPETTYVPQQDSLIEHVVGWGLFVPFAYFVGRGFMLVLRDVSRGFRKVNRHLDESHARWSDIQWRGDRQYIYDHERDEWYVFVAHVEKWEPVS